ncbi:hypothetical protein SAMN05720764_10842 [Fibrobacter sp. UWH5]|nr:hypothetical protein SAMN05720764_10842 [Fibrobacter sp. UWH5]
MRLVIPTVLAFVAVSIHAPTRGAIICLLYNNPFGGFNSRTHAGCDTSYLADIVYFVFQFTHPRGVRYLTSAVLALEMVSIHAPTRGAIKTIGYITLVVSFNSRTHAGCDTPNCPCSMLSRFQFTHPRGVRSRQLLAMSAAGVSIHAPTRGAIRRAVKGARQARFQFTHPRGVRFTQAAREREYQVSIHAPTRGAIRRSRYRRFPTCFNSRTHAGCDRSMPVVKLDVAVSIHAPTRGAISGPRRPPGWRGFNSRTHAGCDRQP